MSAKIAICLATYNGEKYLQDQIDSLRNQTYKNIEILARDDGSSDSTIDILKSQNIKIIEFNKNLGFGRNFITILEYALHNTDAEYFMFCDQDDIWNKNKIEISLNKMQIIEQQHSDMPILIFTDLEIVDSNLNCMNISSMKAKHLNPHKHSFKDMLMQSMIPGCVIIINKKLAQMSIPLPNNNMKIEHDTYVALIASYFGKIDYISESTIKYRQHSNNTAGAGIINICFIIKRLFKYIDLSMNITMAKIFLEKFHDKLDGTTINMLNNFIALNNLSFIGKRRILLKYRLLKHGLLRNIGLFLKL